MSLYDKLEASYTKGSRWRVIADGCSLHGMRSIAPYAWQGERIPLKRGDIIECRGAAMTMGDGMPVVQFIGPKGERLADCEFHPSKWLAPKDGCLERVNIEDVYRTPGA